MGKSRVIDGIWYGLGGAIGVVLGVRIMVFSARALDYVVGLF